MRSVLVSSLEPFTGNSVTIARIESFLAVLPGWSTTVVNADDADAADRIESVVSGTSAVFIGLHAYRAGRHAIRLPEFVRVILILGGVCISMVKAGVRWT